MTLTLLVNHLITVVFLLKSKQQPQALPICCYNKSVKALRFVSVERNKPQLLKETN